MLILKILTVTVIVLVCFYVQRSDNKKAYFMIFERGPRDFIHETVKLLRGRAAEGSSLENLCQSASDYINERVTVLSSLRCSLAIFLAQVCFLWLIVSLCLSVYLSYMNTNCSMTCLFLQVLGKLILRMFATTIHSNHGGSTLTVKATTCSFNIDTYLSLLAAVLNTYFVMLMVCSM